MNLNKLIRYPEKRKTNPNSFEEIFEINIKGKVYIFGAPFSYNGVNNTISFKKIDKTNIYFPNFQILNKGQLALTTAYNLILQVKKSFEKKEDVYKKIIITHYESFLNIGYLQEKKISFLNKIGNSFKTFSKPDILTIEEVKIKRKKFKIENIKEMSNKDIKNKIKEYADINISSGIEEKKGLLTSILIEIVSQMKTDKRKIGKTRLKKILGKFEQNLPELFNNN